MASIVPLPLVVLLSIFLSLSLSTALMPPSSSPPRKPPNSSPNFTLHAPPPTVPTRNHTLPAPPPPLPITTPSHTPHARPSLPKPITTPSHTLQAPPSLPPIAKPSHIRQVSPPPPPIAKPSHIRQVSPPPPPPITTPSHIPHAPPPPPPIAKPGHIRQVSPPPPIEIPSHFRQVSPPSKPQSPPASSNPDNHQMTNIIDSIIGSGDFGNWIDLLMAAGKNNSNSSSLQVRATIFVPDDVALPQSKNPNSEPFPNRIDLDPLLFLYHVVPKRLSFAQLRSYAVGTRLPTLLAGNSILITDNSLFNFTVNDSPISHPDLYLNDAVSVQGIGETFDYKLFGTEDLKNRPLHPPPPPPPSPPPSPPLETNPSFSFSPGEFSGGRRRSCSLFCCLISLVYCFGIVINLLPA